MSDSNNMFSTGNGWYPQQSTGGSENYPQHRMNYGRAPASTGEDSRNLSSYQPDQDNHFGVPSNSTNSTDPRDDAEDGAAPLDFGMYGDAMNSDGWNSDAFTLPEASYFGLDSFALLDYGLGPVLPSDTYSNDIAPEVRSSESVSTAMTQAPVNDGNIFSAPPASVGARQSNILDKPTSHADTLPAGRSAGRPAASNLGTMYNFGSSTSGSTFFQPEDVAQANANAPIRAPMQMPMPREQALHSHPSSSSTEDDTTPVRGPDFHVDTSHDNGSSTPHDTQTSSSTNGPSKISPADNVVLPPSIAQSAPAKQLASIKHLTSNIHTAEFSKIQGGARGYLYALRRQIRPKEGSASVDEFLQNKDYFVTELKDAMRETPSFPAGSTRKLNDRTSAAMATRLDATLGDIATEMDVDMAASAVACLLYDAFIKLITQGDHFLASAMPNHSTFKQMDDEWTPKKRWAQILQGLRECKTIPVNLLKAGDHAFAEFVAEPYSRRNALFVYAASNEGKKMRKEAMKAKLDAFEAKASADATANSEGGAAAAGTEVDNEAPAKRKRGPYKKKTSPGDLGLD